VVRLLAHLSTVLIDSELIHSLIWWYLAAVAQRPSTKTTDQVRPSASFPPMQERRASPTLIDSATPLAAPQRLRSDHRCSKPCRNTLPSSAVRITLNRDALLCTKILNASLILVFLTVVRSGILTWSRLWNSRI